MPQEPITKYFNLKSPSESELLIDSGLPKKPSKLITDNRKKMMGAETKSLLDDAAKQAKRAHEEKYLRAALAGDTAYMYRSQQKFGQELKSMLSDNTISLMEYKVLAPWIEGVNDIGGYGVPQQFLAEFARNLGQFAIARKHFRMVPMTTNVTNLTTLATKPTVTQINENTAIPASTPTIGRLILTAEKLAGLFTTSNEALEDSNYPVWATMQDIFMEIFGIQEDSYALQDDATVWPGALWYGDGTLTASGDLTSNGAIGVARGGSIASGKTGFPKIGDAAGVADCWADWLYMLDAQPSAYYAKGKFFVDQNVAIAMFSLRDTQNRFIADIVNGLTVEIGLDGQPTTFFKGYEIVIVPKGIMLNANTTAYTTSAVPSTPFTFFCNPQKSWLTMGQRGGFRFDTMREGTIDSVSLLANDLQGLRMIERIAFGCGLPYTMVVLRTSAT